MIMGEYRVAADTTITRRVVPLKSAPQSFSLPTILMRQEEVSLFERYMPRYTQRQQQILLSASSASIEKTTESSEGTPLHMSQEMMLNKRYVFWRGTSDEKQLLSQSNDEISAASKKYEEEEREKEKERERDKKNKDKEDGGSFASLKREDHYCFIETTEMVDRLTSSTVIPNENNTVVLSALQHSVLTGKRFKGTYFAFLMSHTLSGKKKDTNIGVSRNPIFSVIAHNNQARQHMMPPGASPFQFPIIYDKDTASAAPYWRLNTVLGPFYTKRAAEQCGHEWVKDTRGTISKQNKARKLASSLHCSMYSAQVPIDVPIERYLYENNAPLSYIKACQSIKRECRDILGMTKEKGKDEVHL